MPGISRIAFWFTCHLLPRDISYGITVLLITYTEACVEMSKEAGSYLPLMNSSFLTGHCLCGFRVPPLFCSKSPSVEIAYAVQG